MARPQARAEQAEAELQRAALAGGRGDRFGTAHMPGTPPSALVAQLGDEQTTHSEHPDR